MTTLGIVGGIGPESTVEYYRGVVATYREQRPDGSYPSIVINSIDFKRMLALLTAEDLTGLTAYLLAEIQNLARAGAEVGLLAANAPHIVFDALQRESPIPLVSIVEATCKAAKGLGLTRLGLFGVGFTMRARFYPEVFSREGITLIVPNDLEQAYIHDKYLNELIPGVFLPATRDRLLAIADRLIDEEHIDGLILGGTELPLILREASYRGIPLLDTTRIHVGAAVARLIT
jgi:aspartate racemase